MTESEKPDPGAFNRRVIEEFRARGGAVGGMFEGAPLLLLTTKGARTGRPHTNPVVYAREEPAGAEGGPAAAVAGPLLVFASNAGGASHPQWYRNLLADPRVTVEIGGDAGVTASGAVAEVVEGAERDRLYARQCERDPGFAAYQEGTERVIPVVVLRDNQFADPVRNRGVAAFLLRVHGELRAELAALRAEVTRYRDGSPVPATGRGLAVHCLGFCAATREHHTNEDAAFTGIGAWFPELGPALRELRAEHRVLAASLQSVEALVRRLPELGPEAVGAELAAFTKAMEDHFTHEEERLIPVLNGAGG